MKTAIFVLTLFFILWELIACFNGKNVYNAAKSAWFKRKNAVKANLIQSISYLYTLYVIFLLFTQYWLQGVFLVILSATTAITLFPYIRSNTPYSNKIMMISITDSMISILILIYILLC
jgi:hypothetical protein